MLKRCYIHKGNAIFSIVACRGYKSDPSSSEIINDIFSYPKCFYTKSFWYFVSMQCNCCDCPNGTSGSKHLYVYIEKHFPHLVPILQNVDNAHGMIQDDGGYKYRSSGGGGKCHGECRKVVKWTLVKSYFVSMK